MKKNEKTGRNIREPKKRQRSACRKRRCARQEQMRNAGNNRSALPGCPLKGKKGKTETLLQNSVAQYEKNEGNLGNGIVKKTNLC